MSYRLTELIESAIQIPSAGSLYAFSRRLRDLFTGQAILETEDYDFQLERFAREGGCACLVLPSPDPWTRVEWCGDPGEIEEACDIGMIEVAWQGKRLQVVRIPVEDGCVRSFIIAESRAVAEAFFAAVCRFSTKQPERIMVYSNSRFRRDPGLERAISGASLDDLTLPESLRQSILSATAGFYASEARYAELGVTWKRGVLLHGPPGNGKTHLLKALVKKLEKPCLYVRSAQSSEELETDSLQRLFTRARLMSPCVIVMEDLDSLVPKSKISALLNELDGFASNHGLLVLATTNYPERLDPALANRPSRFDRKFELPLPDEAMRRAYLAHFVSKWPEAQRPSADLLDKVAKKSDGFAFVHLKEVCLDALAIQVDQTDGEPFTTALKCVRKEMARHQKP